MMRKIIAIHSDYLAIAEILINYFESWPDSPASWRGAAFEKSVRSLSCVISHTQNNR